MSAYFQKYPYSQNKVIVTCTLSYPSGVIQKVESKIQALSRNFGGNNTFQEHFLQQKKINTQAEKSKRDTIEDGEECLYNDGML